MSKHESARYRFRGVVAGGKRDVCSVQETKKKTLAARGHSAYAHPLLVKCRAHVVCAAAVTPSPQHPDTLYLSRASDCVAGASFEVLCLGRWWDSLDRSQWPPGQEAAITEDFQVTFATRLHFWVDGELSWLYPVYVVQYTSALVEGAVVTRALALELFHC